MFLGAGTRLFISPIFKLSAITLKPQLFPLSISKCRGGLLGFGVGFFCQPVLSFPSPPVPNPFRVIYNLLATTHSPEVGDVSLSPLPLPRKENYISGTLCFCWLLKEKSEPCLIFC